MAPKAIRKASALSALMAEVERADEVAPVPAGFPPSVETKTPKKRGRPPGKQNKTSHTMWIENRLSKALRVQAAMSGVNVSEIVTEAVEQWLAENGDDLAKLALAG